MYSISEALKELRPSDMVLIVFKEQNCAVVQNKLTNGTFDKPSICYYNTEKKQIYFLPFHIFKTFREMPDFEYDFCNTLQQRISFDNRPQKQNIQNIYETIKSSKYGNLITEYEFNWGVCTIEYFINQIINKFNLVSSNDLDYNLIKNIFNYRLTIDDNLSKITDINLFKIKR